MKSLMGHFLLLHSLHTHFSSSGLKIQSYVQVITISAKNTKAGAFSKNELAYCLHALEIFLEVGIGQPILWVLETSKFFLELIVST